ncbi:ATP-binding protein [Actinomycetes bacterium NPDC127524]
MHGESERIIKLVENLLFLAKMDREPGLNTAEIQLSELIREMEPQLMMLSQKRQVKLDLTEGIKGTFDPDKIKQVILNLFHNAVQHTDPEKGCIILCLTAAGAEAELSISDNGTDGKLPYTA